MKQRMELFYACMDENNYKEAEKILTEMEAIVGMTDPDIVAARTSLDLEKMLGEQWTMVVNSGESYWSRYQHIKVIKKMKYPLTGTKSLLVIICLKGGR